MRRMLMIAMLVYASLLVAAMPANAEITGGCTATIAGEDAGSRSSRDPAQAISVAEGTSVPWSFTAPNEIVTWVVKMHYGPFSVTVDEGSDPADDEEPDLTRSNVAAVDKYAWMGVGLYKVEGTMGLDGAPSCVGAVLVNVEGNPLTTVLGGGAALVTVAGTAGLGGAALAGFKAAGAGLL